MNYGQRFMTLYRSQRSRPSPRKRNAKKSKSLSEELLKIAVKRREAKSKGEERKDILYRMQNSREELGELRKPS